MEETVVGHVLTAERARAYIWGRKKSARWCNNVEMVRFAETDRAILDLAPIGQANLDLDDHMQPKWDEDEVAQFRRSRDHDRVVRAALVPVGPTPA